MTATSPTLGPTNASTDSDLAHICCVHLEDAACEACGHLECRTYCTTILDETNRDWAPPEAPVCVVCLDMYLGDPRKFCGL